MPKLKKEDVIAQLEELEVEFDPKATYSDLLALLKDQEEKAPTSKEKPDVQDVEQDVAHDLAKEEALEGDDKMKVNPFSSFESKTPMTGKAHKMKKVLAAQHKVHIMIPLGPEEELGVTQQVTLNGYAMFIRKGQMVEVPAQVAEVVNAKLQHQENVRMHPLKVGGVEEIKLKKFN